MFFEKNNQDANGALLLLNANKGGQEDVPENKMLLIALMAMSAYKISLKSIVPIRRCLRSEGTVLKCNTRFLNV